jgi:hypothetical protein
MALELEANGSTMPPTSSSSTASNSSEQQGSQWARASRRAQQLPPLQQELLQVLQCSGNVLLWAALGNAAVLPKVPYEVWGLANAYEQVGQLEQQIAGPMGEVGLLLDPLAEQTGTLHVLLPWAAAQQSTNITFVLSCMMVANATSAATQAVYRQRMLQSASELCTHKLPGIVPDLVLLLEGLLATARLPSSCGSQQRQAPVNIAALNEALWGLLRLLPFIAAPCRSPYGVTHFAWYPDSSLAASEGPNLPGEPRIWQAHAAKVLAVWESHMRLPNALELLDDLNRTGVHSRCWQT